MRLVIRFNPSSERVNSELSMQELCGIMSCNPITVIDQVGLDQHSAPFPKPHMEAFENPERLLITMQYLEENNILSNLINIKTPMATIEEALLVHSDYHVHSVELLSDFGSGQLGESAYASQNLLNSALYSLGGSLIAAELVIEESCKHAFALIRPPGHHATSSSTTGLCYFNNVAVATKKILQEDGVHRVSILDIDDHFGNGTAEIFYQDADVQFISIHEYDYVSYGLGHFHEMGKGDGFGTNINIPLREESPDPSYRSAIDRIVVPAIESFKPDVIAVSAGYDAHFTDPLGDMDVDSRTYWYIANKLDELSSSMGIHGTFWVLEGGYNPLVLGPCVRATLTGLQGEDEEKLEDQEERTVDTSIKRANRRIIRKICNQFSNFF